MADDNSASRIGRAFSVSERSYIQVGLIISLAGFLTGAIWWAATMQSKMDLVIDGMKSSQAMQVKVNENETKIRIIEMRMQQYEAGCRVVK